MDIDAIEFTKILLVDDDVEYSKITGLYLESNGFNITISNDPYKALEMCKQEKYSIILLDYYMGVMNGDEFLNELRKFDTRAVVILQTGYAEKKPPIETLTSLNIQGYYDKSESIEKLLLSIISIMKTMNLLLYRANPDTNKIEYSFMNLKEDNGSNESNVDLDFEDNNLKGYELENDDNNDIERSRFYKIVATNVSDAEEYDKIKKEKKNKEN